MNVVGKETPDTEPGRTVQDVFNTINQFFPNQPKVQELIYEWERHMDGIHTVLQHSYETVGQFGIRTPDSVLQNAQKSAGHLSTIHQDVFDVENTMFAQLPEGKTVVDLLQSLGVQDQHGKLITTREQLDGLPLDEAVGRTFRMDGNAWKGHSDHSYVSNFLVHVPNTGMMLTISDQQGKSNVAFLIHPYLDSKYYAMHPSDMLIKAPVGA